VGFGLGGEELPDPGSWVFVVGPSGSGKDTLLAGAREQLTKDGSFVFARRYITRPDTAGGEDHISVSVAEFDHMAEQELFILHWQAHGLKYGISKRYEDARQSGHNIVVNVSRQVITPSRQQFTNLKIIVVTASRENLARRLASRGRESILDIQSRLSHPGPAFMNGHDVITVDNNGTPAEGVTLFVHALRSSVTDPLQAGIA